MWSIPESTMNVLLGGLLGLVGGLFSIPINAFIMWKLKRQEQYYQHKLNIIAKERELLLQHKLEMKKKEKDNTDIAELKRKVSALEAIIKNREQTVTNG